MRINKIPESVIIQILERMENGESRREACLDYSVSPMNITLMLNLKKPWRKELLVNRAKSFGLSLDEYVKSLDSRVKIKSDVKREILRKYLNEKRTKGSLAVEYGISRRTLLNILSGRGRRRDNSLGQKYFTDEALIGLLKRFEGGLSRSDLISLYGIGESSLSSILNGGSRGYLIRSRCEELGISFEEYKMRYFPRYYGISCADMRVLREMRENNHSLRTISEKLRMDYDIIFNVYSKMKRNGFAY